MVYFGWPKAHEDDAERAVRTALDIVKAVKRVPALRPLSVRIGVATGPVVGERGAGFGRDDSVEQKLDKLEAYLRRAGDISATALSLFAAMLSLPLERYPPLQFSPQRQKEEPSERSGSCCVAWRLSSRFCSCSRMSTGSTLPRSRRWT